MVPKRVRKRVVFVTVAMQPFVHFLCTDFDHFYPRDSIASVAIPACDIHTDGHRTTAYAALT